MSLWNTSTSLCQVQARGGIRQCAPTCASIPPGPRCGLFPGALLGSCTPPSPSSCRRLSRVPTVWPLAAPLRPYAGLHSTMRNRGSKRFFIPRSRRSTRSPFPRFPKRKRGASPTFQTTKRLSRRLLPLPLPATPRGLTFPLTSWIPCTPLVHCSHLPVTARPARGVEPRAHSTAGRRSFCLAVSARTCGDRFWQWSKVQLKGPRTPGAHLWALASVARFFWQGAVLLL